MDASTFSYGFETPASPGAPASSDFTLATTSFNALNIASQFHTGAQSGSFTTQANSATFAFTYTGQNACASGGAFSFWLRMTGRTRSPTSGPASHYLLTATGGQTVGIYIGSGGDVALQAGTSVGSQLGTLALNTWTDFQIVPDCANNKVSGSSATLAFNGQLTYGGSPSLTTATGLNSFRYSEDGPGGSNTPTFFLDDFSFASSTSLGGFIFCSNPASLNFGGDPNADFGYNYAEDIDLANAGDGPTEQSYVFGGDSSDFAFLGKGFTTPSRALNTTFRMTSENDDGDSRFRVSYSFETVTPSSTSKGDGFSTGDFARFIEAQFTEYGAGWAIQINARDAGTTTTLGSTLIQGRSNEYHTYQFQVDTLTSSNNVILRDENGAAIMTRTLPSSLFGLQLYSQWFVGYGTGAILDSYTDLSTAIDKSTCIYALDGAGVPIGDPGGDPGSELVTSTSGSTGPGIFSVSEQNVPAGFTVGAFKMFLGVLMIGGVAAGFYFIHRSPTMAGGGSIVGLFLAFSFGLIPIWVILVLVVLALALIFLKVRGGF